MAKRKAGRQAWQARVRFQCCAGCARDAAKTMRGEGAKIKGFGLKSFLTDWPAERVNRLLTNVGYSIAPHGPAAFYCFDYRKGETMGLNQQNQQAEIDSQLNGLLHKVFDRGVREWVVGRYQALIDSGQTPQQAATSAATAAESLFGPNWKAK